MNYLNLKNTFCLVAAGLLLCPASKTFGGITDDIHVKLSIHRDGDVTHFFVENSEVSEVTMTFNLKLINLKGDVSFPHTATFKPGETEVFTLCPAQTNAPWDYSYTDYYEIGSTAAVPDDFVYSLPYLPGRMYRVTQGYNGKFSHFGSNKYAIDWKMPVGTPVCAARGGLVVKVKDDSNRGGGSMKYDRFNNYILIRHADGTLGHYCHLEKNSARVVPGQIVKTGDIIALSGNTGFSDGPHLHFRVYKTVNGRQSESIPVKYRDAGGQPIELVEGRSYRAPELQTAQAPVPAPKISMR